MGCYLSFGLIVIIKIIMSNTVHRFTPPTCTLSIKAKKLPFFWYNNNSAKKIQFQLSFDDPRLLKSEQVTLKGDRQDLEKLKQVVDRYIQNFLAPSKNSLDLFNKNKPNSRQPYLQPQGLVHHELFLGSLNYDATANKIELSTVQLFDLVTALEAYHTQAALPIDRTPSKSVFFLWGGIAAALVTAVITTIVKSPSANNTATPSDLATPIPQLDEIVPPSAPKNRKPTPKPKPNQLITSTEKLPPPPAVDTPKPKPNIPDPADYPLSRVARQPDLKRSSQNSDQTESVIAPSNQTESNKTINASPNKPDLEPIPELATEIQPGYEQQLARLNDLSPSTSKSMAKVSQLQEIRAYFLDKWQPPPDLKQSLEYRLYLDPDGSIKRIIPLGKASKLYLSKTNIPLQGETFISSFAESQPSTVRLLLNPDGGVRAVRESSLPD